VRDEKELRKIALRINARRISLAQQQHWIDHATAGLKKIEDEVASTTLTARNLAEQLDSLTAQKEDITNHVRRKLELKELDATTTNLMRLKNNRIKEEVRLQKKHNNFAIKNFEHNQVLDKLHQMRTGQGLALGQLYDPKPYRFAQQDLDSNSEIEADAEQETTSEETQAAEEAAYGEAGAEFEESSETEGESQTESDAQTEEYSVSEADSESDSYNENESEADVEGEAETEDSSE